jgi:carboxyl-terminal processing protease
MEDSNMQSRRRHRQRSFGVVALSLMWLLVGIGSGMIVDRQIQADVMPSAVAPASAAPEFRLIAEAWNLIDEHYVDRSAIRSQHLTYAAISGMVNSLGDTGHSVFLTPDEVLATRESIQGHFVGIGAELQMRNNEIVIVAPIDGSPAHKAGLHPGDIIFEVDGKDIRAQTLEQVVHRIRGPSGTKVTLSIRDPRSDRTRTVTLVRTVVHLRSVTWQFLPGTQVADLRIASFSEDTGRDLRKAVIALRRQGARALILDLRSDPGGLLDEAVEVASHFLQGGDVLLVKDAKGRVQRVSVRKAKPKVKLPMVVLTNAGTASAAEIVVGALRDGKRATVVGEQTFGTGTVLEQFPLSDGSALMLAIQEWLTPSGHTIWHKGIEPNLIVALSNGALPVYPEALQGMSPTQFRASKDTQLLKALELLQQHP